MTKIVIFLKYNLSSIIFVFPKVKVSGALNKKLHLLTIPFCKNSTTLSYSLSAVEHYSVLGWFLILLQVKINYSPQNKPLHSPGGMLIT